MHLHMNFDRQNVPTKHTGGSCAQWRFQERPAYWEDHSQRRRPGRLQVPQDLGIRHPRRQALSSDDGQRNPHASGTFLPTHQYVR